MTHAIVQHQPGAFYGWPANSGIWSWGDEIVVGFTEGRHQEKDRGHSFDSDVPLTSVVARSLDGGETWSLERPGNYPQGYSFGKDGPLRPTEIGVPEALDFTHPDLAIRCLSGAFLVSHDRCRTWSGPYAFPTFGSAEPLTSRTDYLSLGRQECLLLLSVKDRAVQAGIADRAFAALTTDGGRTFEALGAMLPERPEVRSVMPSTVRVSETRLVSALRRRLDSQTASGETDAVAWLDCAVSDDLGRTWRHLSRIAETDAPGYRHNGNPPSLVRLVDGRLVCVYGYRAPAYGMRAKVSDDEGASWGPEIVLRDDARTWDFGYPRSVVRPDGMIVSVYYYTTADLPEQHIAATIWHPDGFGSAGADA